MIHFAPGEILLMAAIAIRQRNQDDLHTLIRHMAIAVPDKEAIAIFRDLQRDLEPDVNQWFEDAIASIRGHHVESI